LVFSMDSLILRTVSRIMLPLLLVLSIFMLLRGHNAPGGGFIGGLLAACGLILQIIAFGPAYARQALPISYLPLAALGVLVAICSGALSLVLGQPFMTSLWLPDPIPGIGKLGTPVLFDLGVYCTVVGITTEIALLLAEEPDLSLQFEPPHNPDLPPPEA
jgi:multicomponent Na+:H+ antiporter subunit B